MCVHRRVDNTRTRYSADENNRNGRCERYGREEHTVSAALIFSVFDRTTSGFGSICRAAGTSGNDRRSTSRRRRKYDCTFSYYVLLYRRRTDNVSFGPLSRDSTLARPPARDALLSTAPGRGLRVVPGCGLNGGETEQIAAPEPVF